MKPKIVDLFSGVGGFSLGAARAGFDVSLSVEIDPHAIAAHKKNFPLVRHIDADISLINGNHILDSIGVNVGQLDGLVGGPPCQGFSMIGKREVHDTRNDLFVKFFELVSEIKPKFFVAENVTGIMNDQYSNIRDQAFEFVNRDYIFLVPMKLDASDYGAPTIRKRFFFIGYRNDAINDLSPDLFYSEKIETKNLVGPALIGLPENILDEWITESQSWREVDDLPSSHFYDRVIGNIPEGIGDPDTIDIYKNKRIVSGCFGTRHSKEVRERFRRLKAGERDKISKSIRLDVNGLCPTIRAGTNKDKGSYQAVRPIHPTIPRVISPREAARLQGFPDWFRFAPTKWHSFRQIGNSVSPLLAEIIFKVIVERL